MGSETNNMLVMFWLALGLITNVTYELFTSQ